MDVGIVMWDEEGAVSEVVGSRLIVVAETGKEVMGARWGREGTMGTCALTKMFMMRR
jgi:hypothetical protein